MWGHPTWTSDPRERPELVPHTVEGRIALRAASRLIIVAIFFAPYALWRVSTEYFITISDLLFVLGTIVLAPAGAINLKPFGTWTPLWLMAFVTMLMGLLIGSLVNGDPWRWISASSQYCFGFAVLPFILMSADHERATRYGKAFLAGVFAMEAFGVLIYYFYGGSYEDHQKIAFEFISGAGRLSAFLGDANWNGAMIAMALPFAMYFWAIGKVGNGATIVTLLVLLAALAASGSFTGFGSGLAAITIFVIVAGGRASLKFVVGAMVGLALVFAAGYRPPAVFQKRVATAFEEGDISQAGTFVGRLDLMEEAWQVVENTSFVGLGVDQYRKISRQKAPVHNIYLLLWAEGGLMALIGWLTLLVVLAIGSAISTSYDRPAGALGTAVLVTFILFSCAAPHMYARVWIVPLLVAMAIAFSATAVGPQTATNGYPDRTRQSRLIKR